MQLNKITISLLAQPLVQNYQTKNERSKLMKKLIFTLFASLLFFGTKANHYASSKLNISSWNNAPFIVQLDQQRFAQSSFFTLNRVAPGRRRVKILRRIRNPYCGVQTKVLYTGILHIPRHSSVTARWGSCGLQVVSVKPLYTGPVCKHEFPLNGAGSCNLGCLPPESNCAHGHPFGNCSYGCQNGGSNDGNGGSDGDYYDDGGFDGYETPGMSQRDFDNLQYQIQRSSFDKDRLQIARQGIRAKGVTSAQVRDLMALLTFESHRLKLAKFAFQFTVDLENYYLVNNALTFKGSRRELRKFIGA